MKKHCVYLSLLLSILLTNLTFSEESSVSFSSPNGAIGVKLSLGDACPSVSASLNGETIFSPSPVGFQFEPTIENGWETVEIQITGADSEWSPSWGENATIRDSYVGAIATLRERGERGRTMQFELRAYNEGVAFRYLLPSCEEGWAITADKTSFALDARADAWPLAWTEQTYPEEPVKLGSIEGAIYPPLTVRTTNGSFASLLEWTGDSFPRAILQPSGDGKIGFNLFSEAKVAADVPCATPWRVVAIAADERALVQNEEFLLNLSPELKIDAPERFQPGKTLSNESNCNIQMPNLLSMVDFAAEYGMKYLQIDWGWYGTEWRWSKEEQDKWAETNPNLANDPDWRRNCEADPYTPAKGLVPYSPTWTFNTRVDLDIDRLVAYGREKGIGICFYVNDRMLKTNDLNKLFAEYKKWGLAGLKPGFVKYGSQEDENAIEDMVRIAAENDLWLCVHDEYLPNGFSRPYPNLMSVEGGGGQEGGHPVWHDVTLPFGRGLVGPFDYTPLLYVKGKSKAHQLSLLLTLYNPAPVFRGGWAIKDKNEDEGFGDEKEFLRRVETNWKQTRVLDAKIGKYLIVARQTESGEWQFGATNGKERVLKTVALDFLEPNKKYRAIIWRDAEEEKDGLRSTVREEREVESTDSLELTLAPAGGAVAIFEAL